MRNRRTTAGIVFIAGVVLVAAALTLAGSRSGKAASQRTAGATADPVQVEVLGGPAAGRMALRVERAGSLAGPTLRLVALPAGARDVRVAMRGGAEHAGLLVTAGRPMVLRGLTVLPLVIRGESAAGAPASKAAAPRALEFDLEYSAPASGPPSAALTHSAGFFAPFRDLFPAAQRAALSSTAEGGYLIVAAPDLAATIEPFVAWKRELGYPVAVVTTTETGSQNGQIQAYVRNVYATSPVPPQYLVLVGDLDRVPSFDFHGSISDHPYSLLDGDDFLPDIDVGRLSASGTLDLETIVAKLVAYESDPERVDPSWVARALLVAGNYSSSTPVPVMRWVREELLQAGYAAVDTVYYPPHWATGPNMIRPVIDRGVSLVAYRGWAYGWQGWEPPKFTVEHIPSLANGFRLPVVMSFVCLNMDFTQPECFGEAWIRAGTAAEPKGAVSFIGNSEHWSHTRFNDAAAIGAFRAIGGGGERRLGAILNAAKFEILTQFPDRLEYNEEHLEESVEFYFHIYGLLGDPALSFWSAPPESVLVSHAAALPAGSSLVEVSVRELDGTTPVLGARVGLSQDGAVLGAAFTGEAGTARIVTDLERTDVPATITVTGAGMLPYRASVPVAAGGPYLAFAAMDLKDDGTSGSAGNGDGIANPGETLALEIQLENRGGAPAPAGSAALVALAGATVVTGTATVPPIGAGASGTLTPFTVRIAPEAEDALVASFRLGVMAGADSSISGLTVGVEAPALRHASHVLGGDQELAPGDTLDLLVTVANDGAIGASAASAVLRSFTPGLATVVDSTAAFPAIAAGESGEALAPFRVAADPGAPMGQTANFTLIVTTAEGYVSRTSFGLRLGPVDHRAPLGPDAYGYWAVDNTDTDYPDVAPTYEWVPCSSLYGGTGTKLALGDNTLVSVALPFPFQFYGRTYQDLMVSDNGWAAFDTTSYFDYYNWSMPNPYGAGAQMAAFWDNLDPTKYQGTPENLVGDGVYVYHDAARQRFAIEWSRLGNFFSQHPNQENLDDLQTFQMILFDPAAHPTPTGDGIIRFQYKQVFNNDADRMYSTVGIENETEDIGLEYSYSNLYPDRAAPLSAGLAIDFTTRAPRYVPFRLAAFTAAPAGDGIALRFEPADERPRAGYRIYREDRDGGRSLVPGGALGGAAREFMDRGAVADEPQVYWVGALDPVGHETLLGPFPYAGRGAVPAALALGTAGPNPFVGSARLTIGMPAPGPASLRLYAVSGRLVRTLVDREVQAGTSTLEWDGRDAAGHALPSGIYLGRLAAGGEERELKLVLLR